MIVLFNASQRPAPVQMGQTMAAPSAGGIATLQVGIAAASLAVSAYATYYAVLRANLKAAEVKR